MERTPSAPLAEEPGASPPGDEPTGPASTSLEEHERRNPGLREFLKNNPEGTVLKVVI
jgi:hypothetical protein